MVTILTGISHINPYYVISVPFVFANDDMILVAGCQAHAVPQKGLRNNRLGGYEGQTEVLQGLGVVRGLHEVQYVFHTNEADHRRCSSLQ
ncbi:MAG: hypothetical protein FJ012_01115 [Chloroflexi bacterium]|nr:hypothetical protein [Chloroflexota bacterium]